MGLAWAGFGPAHAPLGTHLVTFCLYLQTVGSPFCYTLVEHPLLINCTIPMLIHLVASNSASTEAAKYGMDFCVSDLMLEEDISERNMSDFRMTYLSFLTPASAGCTDKVLEAYTGTSIKTRCTRCHSSALWRDRKAFTRGM